MAFRVTPILDSGTGADANPIGGNWTLMTGSAGVGVTDLRRVSNQIGGQAGTASVDYWNPGTFNANCEIYCQIQAIGAAASFVDLYFRGKDTASILTFDAYSVRWTVAAGTDTIALTRLDNLAATTLATFNQNIAAGDWFGAQIIGSTLTAFYESAAGAVTVLGTATDSTYTAGGYHTMAINGTTNRVTNFGGGNFTSPAFKRNRSFSGLIVR